MKKENKKENKNVVNQEIETKDTDKAIDNKELEKQQEVENEKVESATEKNVGDKETEKKLEDETKSKGKEIEETAVGEIQKEDKPKKKKGKIKASFQSRKFKNGAYSSIIFVVTLIAVVFVNLIVGKLDLKLDLSSEEMYTLTDQTTKIVDNIKDKVTLYYMVEDGGEINQIDQILSKYDSLSDKITVVKKNYVTYPTFATKYLDSGESVTSNSVIVVDEAKDRSKYVAYQDMLELSYDNYYSTGQASVTAIDVEGQITSAIQYVTNETSHVLYTVDGHGESELSDTLTKAIEKQNITVDTLSTRNLSEVPDDCELLMINAPTSDFSKEEVEMIKTYLSGGKKAVIFTNPTATGLDNFNSLLSYYGLSVVDGIVLDDSSHTTNGIVNYLLPEIQEGDVTAGVSSSNPVIMISAQGLKQVDTRSTVKITSLLQSSTASYSKLDTSDTSNVDKAEEDIDGPFDLGVLVEETYDNKTAQLIVYSTPNMIDENVLSVSGYGNETLFTNSLNYLYGEETGLNIPSRSVEETYITINDSVARSWIVILVVLLPISTVLAGFFIWYRRRKH